MATKVITIGMSDWTYANGGITFAEGDAVTTMVYDVDKFIRELSVGTLYRVGDFGTLMVRC